MLFSLLALLLVVSLEGKNRDYWLLALATLFGFSSQLHYNALFVLGAIIGTTLLIKRPRLKWKTWIGASMILAFFYLPVIAHEIKTGGLNTGLLFEKVSDGSKDEKTKEGPLVKLSQNFRYGAGEFFLILSGNDQINDGHLKGASLGLSCKSCKDNAVPRTIGYIFYVSGAFLLFFSLYKEKNSKRKDFLLVCTLWFLFSFLYFWNLLNNKLYLYPRFFLILSPLPFIFLGLIIEKLQPEKKKLSLVTSLVIVLIISLTNLSKVFDHFMNLKNVSEKEVSLETEDVFPNTNRATLFLHKKVIEEIKMAVTDKEKPVYLLSESEYEPVYWYLLEKEGIDFQKNLSSMVGEKKFFENSYYFVIHRAAESEKANIKGKLQYFDTISKKDLGSLIFLQLQPKAEWLTGQIQDPNSKETLTERCQADRMLDWKDLAISNNSAVKKATRLCKD